MSDQPEAAQQAAMLQMLDQLRGMVQAGAFQTLVVIGTMSDGRLIDPAVCGRDLTLPELLGMLQIAGLEAHRKLVAATERAPAVQAGPAPGMVPPPPSAEPVDWRERRVPDGRGGFRLARSPHDVGDGPFIANGLG